MCPHIAEPAREWVKLYSPKAKQGCPLKLVADAITLKNKKTAQKKQYAEIFIQDKNLISNYKKLYQKLFMPKKTKKLGNLDIFRALQSTNAENHSRWKKNHAKEFMRRMGSNHARIYR